MAPHAIPRESHSHGPTPHAPAPNSNPTLSAVSSKRQATANKSPRIGAPCTLSNSPPPCRKTRMPPSMARLQPQSESNTPCSKTPRDSPANTPPQLLGNSPSSLSQCRQTSVQHIYSFSIEGTEREVMEILSSLSSEDDGRLMAAGCPSNVNTLGRDKTFSFPVL